MASTSKRSYNLLSSFLALSSGGSSGAVSVIYAMWTLLQMASKLSVACGGGLQWKGAGTEGCVRADMSGVGAELAVSQASMACFKPCPLPLLGMSWLLGRWMWESLTMTHLELTHSMAVAQLHNRCPRQEGWSWHSKRTRRQGGNELAL